MFPLVFHSIHIFLFFALLVNSFQLLFLVIIEHLIPVSFVIGIYYNNCGEIRNGEGFEFKMLSAYICIFIVCFYVFICIFSSFFLRYFVLLSFSI